MKENGKIEIRDTRNGDWFWAYNALIQDPHLTAADVRTYTALATYAGYAEIRPSFPTLAKRACLSLRGVKNSIAKLERVGYIQVERSTGRGLSNRYDLLKAVKGCKFCTDAEMVQKAAEKGAEKDNKTVQIVHAKKNEEKYKEIKNPLCSEDIASRERSLPVQSEDKDKFIEIMAHKGGVRPERILWSMERIAAKANGQIRSLAYFRTAFPDFIKREKFELIDHLTEYGVKELRTDPATHSSDVLESLKLEAARIGFADYSDAVNSALRNLRKGVRAD